MYRLLEKKLLFNNAYFSKKIHIQILLLMQWLTNLLPS